jgi:sugar phosphate isomerase/epimerase
MNDISRRSLLYSAAATALARPMRADDAPPQTKMGIASTSFTSGAPGGAPAPGAAGARPRGRDTFEFLEKCHGFGAGGIQTQLNGDLSKVRARAEQLGMWIEGMAGVPRNGDMAPLERTLMDAKAAGATAFRCAMLSGRRYESFSSLADWKKWVDQSHDALKLVVPLLEKHKVVLAMENHKDWTLEDMLRVLKTYSSEYLGVCVDFGNNISLLDDPMAVIEGLAPYAKAAHIKDVAVRPYEDGFQMSEVPLGAGILDLPRIVSMLQKANPKLHFSLEMMTRDPLKVPCMTPQYWTVFPERNGKYLAQTLKLVQAHGSAKPLPTVSQLSREDQVRVEEENVKACMRYASEKKLIA